MCSINLAIHVLAAFFCATGPFSQLRLVNLRGKLGYPTIYDLDLVDDAWEKEGESK